MRWNEKRPYDFLDGIPRLQDNEGLYRRQPTVWNDKLKKLEVRRGFEPETGEVLEDWKGKYVIMKNGGHLYVGMSEKVEKLIKSGKYKVGLKPNFYYKTMRGTFA